MSNARKAAAQPVPSISTSGKRKITAKDKKPFQIDDVTYHLLNPKAYLLSQAAASIDPTRPWTEGENYRAIQRYAGFLLEYVERTPPDPDTGMPTGRELLMHRLADAEDDLDIDDITGLFVQIMEGWFSPRPTGSPRASAPRRTGSRSGGSRASTP